PKVQVLINLAYDIQVEPRRLTGKTPRKLGQSKTGEVRALSLAWWKVSLHAVIEARGEARSYPNPSAAQWSRPLNSLHEQSC
ncbi:MAG: hypothetical protein ACI84E_002429, partial [Planctomycetota bacterium]